MTFADIPSGTSVFPDANTFVYACAPDPQLGPACLELLERVEQSDVLGFTSTHVLSDVAHRLMTLEACTVLGWSFQRIAQRLHQHRDEIPQLQRFRQAIENIIATGIQFLPVGALHIAGAAAASQSYRLLSGDALCVVLMQERGIASLASHDTDFDSVPGIVRFGPI